MYFNDGSDPWNVEENHIRVFNFDGSGAKKHTLNDLITVLVVTSVFMVT